ncbi:MAG: GAF domain-containing protein [Planctomycetia bacterium]|nr:GAF domain-containing protein [Planctomycetia bacterium]
MSDRLIVAEAPSPESSLLLTLEEVSQLVAHSHQPRETLSNIVCLIQQRFHTHVCSVYLLEPESAELVLAATVGLQPEGIGRVRMKLTEGLTGLVAEQMAPVMVEDAFGHPRFKYFPEAGEDPYHSFLGVPLIEAGVLQGVLVVQTAESRRFLRDEVRMLVTVAAQLAPLVSEARLLQWVVAAAHDRAEPTPHRAAQAEAGLCWQGAPLSPGIGLGQAYLVDGAHEWQLPPVVGPHDADCEKQRLLQAMQAADAELTRLGRRLADLVGEEHGAILHAQRMILQDRAIADDLVAAVAAGNTAEQALLLTMRAYVAAFEKVAAPQLQDRVYDLKDIFRRIRWYLRPAAIAPGEIGGRIVLVAPEASVLDLLSVDLEHLAAVVVEQGGPHCHAAILARSLGVPMVGQMPKFLDQLTLGRTLQVDGQSGRVCLDPPSAVAVPCTSAAEATPAARPRSRPTGAQAGARRSRQFGAGRNGTALRVEANVNLLCEAADAVAQGAAGVGLFRSEFLFLARRTPPSEEEQVGFYRKLLTRLGGRPVTIRTFDLRADKQLPGVAGPTAPVYDWPRVLESPSVQRLFKEQVRAILRAGAAGPIRLLVPYICRGEQLAFVRDAIERAKLELRQEGLPFAANVPVGVMIEVAAAIPLLESWAWHVDFFALGTNDLLASALGIDRDNPVGATRDDLLHPGLLHLIRDAVAAARRAGRKITVCGEMAADPDGVLALHALRVDAVSVPVNQLQAVRQCVAQQPPDSLVTQLISAPTAEQVRQLLEPWRPEPAEAAC